MDLDRKRAFRLKMGLLGKTDVLKGFLGKIRAIWIKNGALREILLKGLKISILNGLKISIFPKSSILNPNTFFTQKSP